MKGMLQLRLRLASLTWTTVVYSGLRLFLAVEAHTYLITPPSRMTLKLNAPTTGVPGSGVEGALCHVGQGSSLCCDGIPMATSSQKTVKRGDSITTSWWRNNHVGGFVRYSIVPTSAATSQDAFDAAVFSMACNQVGCTQTYNGQSPNNWNGGDSDGNEGWSNPCSGEFVVPYHLADGAYTIQWIWFGQGNGGSANSPFQSCIDIQISGGNTVADPPTCPLWKGGDLSEKSQNACVYVSVPEPTYQGVCLDANACSGGSYLVGVPEGLDTCLGGNPPKTYTLGMVVSNGFPDTLTPYSSNQGNTGNASSTGSGPSINASVPGNTSTASTASSASEPISTLSGNQVTPDTLSVALITTTQTAPSPTAGSSSSSSSSSPSIALYSGFALAAVVIIVCVYILIQRRRGSQHHMPHHLDDSDENTESESDESPEDKGSDDSDEKGYSDGQSSDSEHTSEHRR